MSDVEIIDCLFLIQASVGISCAGSCAIVICLWEYFKRINDCVATSQLLAHEIGSTVGTSESFESKRREDANIVRIGKEHSQI